mgnify:CR=1 FL=1
MSERIDVFSALKNPPVKKNNGKVSEVTVILSRTK